MAKLLAGVDASSPCTETVVKCLIKSDTAFVCRYYSRTTKIKGKRITLAEAQRLSKAGIKIVTVYEDGPTKYSYFNKERGAKDAASALLYAAEIGQPKKSAIYFAVDYDAKPSQIASEILNYFQAVHDTINGEHYVGVYGSGAVCAAVLAAGTARYAWLAQSKGWLGYKTFKDWSIKQGPEQAICKLNSDTDVAQGSYGGFIVPFKTD